MDHLIKKLENKIHSLVNELADAKEEIKTLRQQLNTVISSEHHELIDKSQDFPATDQLQIYIDDSLDLSISSLSPEPSIKKKKMKSEKKQSNDQQNQLSFDLTPNENSRAQQDDHNE
ncbi:hypothetical protein CBF23_013910 [Marinomonas agarivorans]|nr:hypothetical protein CBF23_013910 [Marinomonas agarivorans]